MLAHRASNLLVIPPFSCRGRFRTCAKKIRAYAAALALGRSCRGISIAPSDSKQQASYKGGL